MKKNFILGVGAQKSGTTWLHQCLSSQAYSNFGYTKEYQLLHAMYEDYAVEKRREIVNSASEKMMGNYANWRGSPKAHQLSCLCYHAAYYEYFNSLLRAPGVHLTGDITPVYSALNSQTLIRVKHEFEARDINVIPIFIMRDPVYRLQSYIRMRFRERKIKPTYNDEINAMRAYVGSKDDMKRCNYEHTHSALEKAFGSQILIFFYETLFNPEQITRIEKAIGNRLLGINLKKKVGASTSKNLLAEDDYLDFREAYLDIFDFVERKYPSFKSWYHRD